MGNIKKRTGSLASNWVIDGSRRIFVYANNRYEWAVGLRAKIDTGASLSSIDNELALSLSLEEIGNILIRNANGKDRRPVYSATIKFEGEVYDINLSGADRSYMEFPVILGRDLLSEICLTEEE